MSDNVIKLRAVRCPYNGDETEGGAFFAVGYSQITKITMTQDLPGMYGNLWQVNVYQEGKLFVQIPRHNTETIEYAAE